MPASRARIRGPALIAASAFALHQLRYLLAAPGPSGLERSDHAYLPFAATLAAVLLTLAAGQLALRVARARDNGTGEAEPPAVWRVWLAAAFCLVSIFVLQELLESVVAGGPAENPLAHGGLLAIPLAMLLGALVALALRWANHAVRAAARRSRSRLRRPGRVLRPVWRPARPCGSVLARHLAGRAPPQPA